MTKRCTNNHLTGTKNCGFCGAPAVPVSLSREYQPLTETTRAGVTREISVRELRALSRQRLLNGGLCDRKELHGGTTVTARPKRVKYSFLARYKKART